MGYTHNWTTTMPPGDVATFMFSLESHFLSTLLPHFNLDLGVDGNSILFHRSGQAESLSLGPMKFDFGESCKTDRGVAELHIAELLWRTTFAINDAGGAMRLHSDCTWAPLRGGVLNEDTGLFLAVLIHRCADLLKGRTLEVKAVPQHWPQVSCYRDIKFAQESMLQSTPEDSEFDHVVFELDTLNEADFNVVLKPGTANFRGAVYRHTQAIRLSDPPSLRGMLSNMLQVFVDGKLVAGKPIPFDQHPEVIKRTQDISNLIPSAQWLDEIEHERSMEAQEA